jgi:23S rRNA (adenine2503-C2)-methyltransferase
MKIIKNVVVPTGNILIVEGTKGKLECLSIGDYGKEKNLKADFMGLNKEINGVPHGCMLPLEDKWVITISTQYGCSMDCKFCDVPKVGKGINATASDLIDQVRTGISLHPEIKHTKRLNVHYARMGEPTWNFDVLQATRELKNLIKIGKGWGFHPVVSTMMPNKNVMLPDFLDQWLYIKNSELNGEAGLQLSINTTDEKIRQETIPNGMTLEEISFLFDVMLSDMSKKHQLSGRKYTLNFALTDAEINAEYLRELFTPRLFLCKITPMHRTHSCEDNNLLTDGGYDYYYPYKKVEDDLKKVGFDVIVFIPSKEEDESRITCGNAILSNKEAL